MNSINKIKLLEEILKTHVPNGTIKLINETSLHNVPLSELTHIKLIIIADLFKTKTRIERHKIVYKIIEENFPYKLHAISLHLFSSEEITDLDLQKLNSPPCAKKHTKEKK